MSALGSNLTFGLFFRPFTTSNQFRARAWRIFGFGPEVIKPFTTLWTFAECEYQKLNCCKTCWAFRWLSVISKKRICLFVVRQFSVFVSWYLYWPGRPCPLSPVTLYTLNIVLQTLVVSFLLFALIFFTWKYMFLSDGASWRVLFFKKQNEHKSDECKKVYKHKHSFIYALKVLINDEGIELKP